MLTFDAETHRYFWNGDHVPNVTSIIHDLTDMSMIPPATLEIARQKGVAVHKMVELWAKNELGERNDQPEWIRPVYDKFLSFVDDFGLVVLSSEKKVYHPVFKYAGTLDLRCSSSRKLNGVGILDIKRSFLAGPAIGLQLAGYAGAEDSDKSQEPVKWRAALKLNERDPCRLEMYEDKSDWSVFLGCLVRHNWLKKHGK